MHSMKESEKLITCESTKKIEAKKTANSCTKKETDLSSRNSPDEELDKIKRPMNAFMLWSKEERRRLSEEDPKLHNAEISKLLGKNWKKLSLTEKLPYVEKSQQLMQKHKLEHPNYHYKPRQNKQSKLKDYPSFTPRRSILEKESPEYTYPSRYYTTNYYLSRERDRSRQSYEASRYQPYPRYPHYPMYPYWECYECACAELLENSDQKNYDNCYQLQRLPPPTSYYFQAPECFSKDKKKLSNFNIDVILDQQTPASKLSNEVSNSSNSVYRNSEKSASNDFNIIKR